MHFSIMSMAILTLVVLIVLKNVIKGRKEGFARSVIALCSLIFSAIASIIASILLSDTCTEIVARLFLDDLPVEITDLFPSMKIIAVGAVDCLFTPVIFLLLFPIVYFLTRMLALIFNGVARKKSKRTPGHIGSYKTPRKSDDPSYLHPEAPWHVRHDKALGGVVRGVCGFLAFLILFSPVIGVLNILNNVSSFAKKQETLIAGIGLNTDTVSAFDPIVNDSVVGVLSFAGGKLIFDGMATTELIEGNTVSLGQEIDAGLNTLSDVLKLIDMLSGKEELSDEHRKTIEGLKDDINSSDTMKLLAKDFVVGLSSSWLDGKEYFGIPCPKLPSSIDWLFRSILATCAQAKPECVAGDLETLLNLYVIIVDSGLMGDLSEDELSEILDGSGLLDAIYAELDKNECMRNNNVTGDMLDAMLHLTASTIDLSNLTGEERTLLMTDIADSINEINADGDMTFEEKVDKMTDYTIEYATDKGIEVPKDIAEMAVTSILQQLDGTNYTAEEIDRFFEYYSNKTN